MARLLEKMKKLAVKLSEEEQDEFMEFVATLDAPVSAEKAPLEDKAQAVEETPSAEPQAEPPAEPDADLVEPDADPVEPNGEPPAITQPLALDPVAEPAQAEPDQVAEPQTEQQPEPQPQEEDIPVMGYGEQTPEDDDVCDTDTSTALQDTDGENMPIDSSEIIEAQGAKTMALEAENSRLRAENEQLKAKVDGAFGYSSKPSMPVKINKLYDNTDTPIMHK